MQQRCQQLLPFISANAEQAQLAGVGEMGSHSMGDMGLEEQILFPTLPNSPKSDSKHGVWIVLRVLEVRGHSGTRLGFYVLFSLCLHVFMFP